MDREKLYSEWLQTQIPPGEAFYSSDMINKMRKISDRNFILYKNYQDHLISTGQTKSIKSRRSKITDLLVFISERDLKDVTQEFIDEYFENYCQKDSPKTNESRINYLKAFFKYSSLLENIDLEKHRKPVDKKRKKMTRISAEQISLAREKYINDRKKLFVFEMMYYTSFSMAEIGKIKTENVFPQNNKICYGSKENIVPNSLINLIQTMSINGEFDKSYDIVSTIKQMRKELGEMGLGKMTSNDGKATKNTTFWKCPQCGYEYEAIAENWCIKQYTENGDNWIVCIERCGHE